MLWRILMGVIVQRHNAAKAAIGFEEKRFPTDIWLHEPCAANHALNTDPSVTGVTL